MRKLLQVLLLLASVGEILQARFAYVANFGSKNVSGYIINASTGALTPIGGSPFAAGTGPFSVAMDPTGKFAYVANQRDTNRPAKLPTNSAEDPLL